MGGVEFANVEDCWGRDLRFINSDNGVMVAYVRFLEFQRGDTTMAAWWHLRALWRGRAGPCTCVQLAELLPCHTRAAELRSAGCCA